MNEPAAVLRNVAGGGNRWLGVELAGDRGGDVVGARVVAEADGRAQTRFAKGGGSYASSPDRRLVFGFGPDARAVKLRVVWPDGLQEEWPGVETGRYYRAARGQPQLTPSPPGR
jgi:enediyne biosynthesis protein E4